MGSDYNHYKMFGYFSRKFKMTEPEPPEGVVQAFRLYTDGGTEMKADQLWRFLVEHQKEHWRTVDDAKEIMRVVLERRNQTVGLDTFTIYDFFYFLFQDDLNGPINPQVHHDMTAPLHHYYIYTGHNSYLTGNQLSSDCSDVPIIKALENGVRGIELDLWPNSARDNVQVLHGRTLTAPVPLLKCFESIKKHAFVTTPYPVIITLEDHLTPDLQAKVAEMATQTFGDMLFCPGSGCLEEFPSPEELKYRIILSTKPPKEYLGANNNKDGENKADENKDGDNSSLKDDSDDEPGVDYKSDSDDEAPCNDSMRLKSVNYTAPEYKRLICIHARNSKNTRLSHCLKHDNRAIRLSLSEQEIERAASVYSTRVVRFTQNNLLRVYPKGTRVNSSNYRPSTGWIHGAQMVAFNMQGYGKSLWMMHGVFRSNGCCGYVKKPDILMKRSAEDVVFDPKFPWAVKTTLKVNVYMGDGWRMDFSKTHFDKHSPPDFYTKIYVIGLPQDAGKSRTRIILDDWIPRWEQEFLFPLRIPELALLRIEVREYDRSEKDDFGGQTCLLISELRPGIRSVPLYSKKGQKYKSVRLLMGFSFV